MKSRYAIASTAPKPATAQKHESETCYTEVTRILCMSVNKTKDMLAVGGRMENRVLKIDQEKGQYVRIRKETQSHNRKGSLEYGMSDVQWSPSKPPFHP
jgi:predicted RNA-binding protein with RPS1 domain